MNTYAKTLLAAALLSLSCFAAQAADAAVDQHAANQAGQVDAAKPTAAQQEIEPNCLRYTGSLIIAAQNRRNERRSAGSDASKASRPACNGCPGQSYTREDIQRTGATNAADAIRRLDPAAW
jgi:hypothetical protein